MIAKMELMSKKPAKPKVLSWINPKNCDAISRREKTKTSFRHKDNRGTKTNKIVSNMNVFMFYLYALKYFYCPMHFSDGLQKRKLPWLNLVVCSQ